MNRRYEIAEEFLNIFERMLVREKIDLDNDDISADISSMFEIIASNLLSRSNIYFDGAIDLVWKIRKSCQVEFQGKLWVGNYETQWLEPFRALVTDKRVTKQGIWITIWFDSEKAEGELLTAFNFIAEERSN